MNNSPLLLKLKVHKVMSFGQLVAENKNLVVLLLVLQC